MSEDLLKFFQSYVLQMIDIGGDNLPKSISSSLGAKIGKLYKKQGISKIEDAFIQLYKALNVKVNIQKVDDKTYRVKLKFKKKFCPTGGGYNPKKADIVHGIICRPYTMGLLNTLDPNHKYDGELLECHLKSNNGICEFIIRLEEKEN